MTLSLRLGALAFGLLAAGSASAAVPNVVASIKPIHSLVASVMGDLGSPTLLVQGSASPHTYSLRPSDAEALEGADLVFWTGHGLELFLGEPLETLAGDATILELSEIEGLTLLPIREGGAFEAHAEHEGEEGHAHEEGEEEHAPEESEGHEHEEEHGHEGEDHAHGEADLHFFLDPQNAKLMVSAIADSLAEADPENAETYRRNAEAEASRLDALEGEIAQKLSAVADTPFLVFHDAYQYFEARFGLTIAGSVTVSPEVNPGAQRITALQEKIAESGAACIFQEPQFSPAIVQTITEGSDVRIGVLDPEGSGLTEGPELYSQLLHGLADALVECLAS